jgi:hypothetical protein
VIQQLLRQQHTAAARSQQSRNPALLAWFSRLCDRSAVGYKLHMFQITRNDKIGVVIGLTTGTICVVFWTALAYLFGLPPDVSRKMVILHTRIGDIIFFSRFFSWNYGCSKCTKWKKKVVSPLIPELIWS